jgi:hypothetical protein
VERQIISEISNSSGPVYSVLANEASDCGNKEQMSTVVWYIDTKKEINERILRFVDGQEGMMGLALTKYIEDTLDDVGLPLQNC